MAAILALAGCAARDGEPGYRPNVLIILIDALRADRLGVNGYPLPTTPEIDSLAQEGVNFTQAFSHSTWTKPSIATLFTSLYPEQHGLDMVAVEAVGGLATDSLDGQFITLAERFHQAGYVTGAVINQVHLQEKFGFGQGFELFIAQRGRVAPQLNQRMVRWFETLESDRPFFAYLHYLDPHWPYRQRLKKDAPDLGSTAMDVEPPGSAERIPRWRERVTKESDWRALEARYDHEVAYVDRAVGSIVQDLRRLGRFEDTLVVITSDHGEAFLEHGELVHGLAPYDEVIHIPLVLRLPEPLRARTGNLDRPVGLVDLGPTLYELAGLEPTGQEEGRSLASWIRGGRLGDRPIFAQGDGWTAARSLEHKLMTGPKGEELFFALVSDPGEQSPEAGPCSGPCDHLKTRLTAFLEHMERSRYTGEGGQIRLDEDEIEDLRALGYLD
jgi:arylsulfatase